MINIIIHNGDYYVYIHTNQINGKRYVGITHQKPNDRWRNGDGYKHCPVFYRAIQKYGWDCFDHEIFASNLTREEAENMERILINKLQTLCNENGYNASEGGYAPSLTSETKKKISETHFGIMNPMFGKKHTNEEKEHLREMMSGDKNPRYGKHCSEETKAKISAALKGRPTNLSPEQKRIRSEKLSIALKGRAHADGAGRPPKKIVCVETGEVFVSIADAARQKGIRCKNSISRVAKGKQSICGGYHWKYYEEENQDVIKA